jgi:hypothetical protein
LDILIHSKFIAVLHKGDTKNTKKRIGRNTTDLSPQEQIVKRWYPVDDVRGMQEGASAWLAQCR